MLNLDSMTRESLLKLHDEIRIHPRLSAKKYGLSVRDIKAYKNYAINKAVAMQCRQDGEIAAAKNYEGICDRLYSEMTVKQW